MPRPQTFKRSIVASLGLLLLSHNTALAGAPVRSGPAYINQISYGEVERAERKAAHKKYTEESRKELARDYKEQERVYLRERQELQLQQMRDSAERKRLIKASPRQGAAKSFNKEALILQQQIKRLDFKIRALQKQNGPRKAAASGAKRKPSQKHATKAPAPAKLTNYLLVLNPHKVRHGGLESLQAIRINGLKVNSPKKK